LENVCFHDGKKKKKKGKFGRRRTKGAKNKTKTEPKKKEWEEGKMPGWSTEQKVKKERGS